jgi:SHS2 domain-containing protein
MPFEEIQHTADWSLHAWAEDLPGLFAEAARGMGALAGMRLVDGPRTRRKITIRDPDAESLLVSFLSELLYLGEEEKLGFDEFDLRFEVDRLEAEIGGAAIHSINKIIKAVTYHNLQIRQTGKGFEVEIVFDV